LNFANFSKSGDLIFAGGKSQEVKIFDRQYNQELSYADNNWVFSQRYGGFENSVYCSENMNVNDGIIAGGAEG